MTIGIYAYKDLYKDEIIYIGKSEVSIENRHKQHLKGNQVIDNILQTNPNRYELIILKECKPVECDIFEKEYIEEFQTFRYKHGKGFNFTSGGDGGQRKPDLWQDDLHGVELILRKFEDSPYYFKLVYKRSVLKKDTIKTKTLDEMFAEADKLHIPIFSYSELAKKYPYDNIYLPIPEMWHNPLESRNFPFVTEHIYKIRELPNDKAKEYVYNLASNIYGQRFLDEVKLICKETGFENDKKIQSKIKEREYFVDTTFYERYVENIKNYENGTYVCSKESYDNLVKFIEEYEEKYKDK